MRRGRAGVTQLVECQLPKLEPPSVTDAKPTTSEQPSGALSNIPSSQQQNRPADTDLADLLDAFPESERPTVLDHLRFLATMDPQKRAAVLTLARA